MFHWCTHKRAKPGYVAVWTRFGQSDWHWAKAERVKPQDVILCVACGKPAVQVDHLFPYESYYCRCADHLAEGKEGSE